MASLETIGKVWLILVECYPHSKTSDGQAKTYQKMLEPVPDDLLEAAAFSCLDAYDYLPTIHQLKEMAKKLGGVVENDVAGAEAWGIIQKTIARYGTYLPDGFAFSDPELTECVHMMGGWDTLCLSENHTADRARFIDLYDQRHTRLAFRDNLHPHVKSWVAERMAELAQAKRLLGNGH